MTRPVMIAAGGTGGHVFPALAVADVLRDAGVPVVWLGTPTGLEARLVPAAGIEIELISVVGLRGRGLLRWMLAPLTLGLAMLQTLRAFLRRRPAVVLGMGGFASGPGGLLAWINDLPLVVHEQNAVRGLTNRVLAPLATRVLHGFPHSDPRVELVGNPVRADIVAIAEPAERFAGRTGALRVLVLGGSQGSRALNRVLPEAAARSEVPLEIHHQTGQHTAVEAREALDAVRLPDGVSYVQEVFIEDMAEAYAWADIAICRAGALSLAELAAAGLGALLVPFPAAVDDHQTANACWSVEVGAAELIAESQLHAEDLAVRLGALSRDRVRCLVMAEAARSCARPDAAALVAEVCMSLHPEVAR